MVFSCGCHRNATASSLETLYQLLSIGNCRSPFKYKKKNHPQCNAALNKFYPRFIIHRKNAPLVPPHSYSVTALDASPRKSLVTVKLGWTLKSQKQLSPNTILHYAVSFKKSIPLITHKINYAAKVQHAVMILNHSFILAM